MKSRISSARACVKVLQSFSSQAFTSGRSPLELVVSVRLGENRFEILRPEVALEAVKAAFTNELRTGTSTPVWL
jgi:hypothetical protein